MRKVFRDLVYLADMIITKYRVENIRLNIEKRNIMWYYRLVLIEMRVNIVLLLNLTGMIETDFVNRYQFAS